MNTVASWAGLRAAINKLRPEDADGFEGLVASLFAAETGERFFAARRGDQPVGDAYSAASGTALQAKRYRTAEISANNVDGEISRALREAPTLKRFSFA